MILRNARRALAEARAVADVVRAVEALAEFVGWLEMRAALAQTRVGR